MSKRCPIPMGDGICGEPNSLEIISQFNRLFQERLAEIEAQSDGGCLMEKIKLQEEWIHDLTEQNNMLVRVVQQLESEAVDRVHQLEEKLQRSGQCLHEVMKKYREHNFAADLLSEPLQKITHFEDDMKNVIEFVRRIREEQQWSLDGLFFHNIKTSDLMGTNMYKLPHGEDLEGREELRVKEGMIKELTDKVNYLESFGNPQELTRELQCRRQECETLQQTTCQIDCLNETNKKLQNENIALKEATSVVKTHLEQLDQQFNNFLRERNSLKRKNKGLERTVKISVKEKESLQCKCEVLLKEIEQLKTQKDSLVEAVNSESAALKQKINELTEENRKAIERVVSLNEENVSLTETVDLLRQRSDYTTNFTQEEVSKLNCTIEELKNNLEKTQFLHDQEEEAHKKEVSLLNDTIASLQDQLKTVDQKVQKGLKACKICKKRSKVGFLENTEVQADLEVKEDDLMKVLKEQTSKMKADIDRKNSEIDTLRNKVNELEGALKTCDERAINLQDAVSTYCNSITILEKSEEAAQSQIQQQKITISNLQQALVDAKQEVDEIRKKSRDNVSGGSWSAWFGLSTPGDVVSNNNNNNTRLNNC